MNIFFLSALPRESAELMVDKHVVKMIVESAQLLSTAHRVLDGVDGILPDFREELLYKATHRNHPSAVWARSSSQNYYWLYSHFEALLDEYTYRYGKTHKTSEKRNVLRIAPNNIANDAFTVPPACMPEEYRIGTARYNTNNSWPDTVESYRNYYNLGKRHIHKWKNREIPSWIT